MLMFMQIFLVVDTVTVVVKEHHVSVQVLCNAFEQRRYIIWISMIC